MSDAIGTSSFLEEQHADILARIKACQHQVSDLNEMLKTLWDSVLSLSIAVDAIEGDIPTETVDLLLSHPHNFIRSDILGRKNARLSRQQIRLAFGDESHSVRLAAVQRYDIPLEYFDAETVLNDEAIEVIFTFVERPDYLPTDDVVEILQSNEKGRLVLLEKEDLPLTQSQLEKMLVNSHSNNTSYPQILSRLASVLAENAQSDMPASAHRSPKI